MDIRKLFTSTDADEVANELVFARSIPVKNVSRSKKIKVAVLKPTPTPKYMMDEDEAMEQKDWEQDQALQRGEDRYLDRE